MIKYIKKKAHIKKTKLIYTTRLEKYKNNKY